MRLFGYQIAKNNNTDSTRSREKFTDGSQIACSKMRVRSSYPSTETGSYIQVVTQRSV